MTRNLYILLTVAIALAICPADSKAQLRRSPVSYHVSFETTDFFEDDIIAQSGKKSIEERQIDFPEGRFGKGIRMNSIPAPFTVETANGIDLDPATAIFYSYYVGGNPRRFFEPAIWGAGKLNPRLGGVAFWVKGSPPYPCRLFTQASSAFGRKERDLLAVSIDDDNKITAFLRDARYVRHTLSAESVWNAENWNHIVFNWDWANGLELWLNGEVIASTWGKDGWYETMHPGLFQLSAPGFTYDELYLFDRPVNQREIKRLMAQNKPPGEENPVYDRKQTDRDRMARISGANDINRLPVVTAGDGLSVREVWPCSAADGHVQGWYIIDGRNEMAWPLEYSFFTTTPGDADFHAEKVDITIPGNAKVNYVTLTGNLTDVKVQAGSVGMEDAEDLFSVPGGERFFYGSTITATTGSTFRLPFTTSYGCPPGYQGEVINLPLSGVKRIHNVGLYSVEKSGAEPQGNVCPIALSDGSLGNRYDFALHALKSRDERNVALAAVGKSPAKRKTVDIGGFSRLNIISEPYTDPTGVASVTLRLPMKTVTAGEALFVRVHDPAVPSRLWNQFAVKLEGFDKVYAPLELTIDFQDLVLTGGDRLWIDIGTCGSCALRLGDRKTPSELIVSTIPAYMAVDAYAEKEITPAKAQYSKMYEFMPWKLTGKTATIENPYSFGGAFDMIMPALAILRVKPDHFAARFMEQMCGPTSRQIQVDGTRLDPSLVTLKIITDTHGAPDWALYMNEYLKYGHAIIDWWAERQNSDGQLGGGWNDDTLFIGHHQPYLPLDGNANARAIIDSVHTKIAKTGFFKDGYCRITPMDRLHTGDLISERYTTVVNNIGQAYAAEREMESAWHAEHPERTPLNYGDGRAFRSSRNVLNWYWGLDVPDRPYVSQSLAEVTGELRLCASVWTDFAVYRYTEAGVHRDDYRPYGANSIYRYLLAGTKGSRTNAHPNFAVTWPSGGGPEVARIILNADDTSLRTLCYSFDSAKRDLAMRLCRIQDGRYRIHLYNDPGGNGNAGELIWELESELRRFDVVTLPIPPRTPLIIEVKQIESYPRPAELPDLAIDTWDAKQIGRSITATVHNIGNGGAENIVVRLLDGDTVLRDTTIGSLEAPVDFKPKRATVTFDGIQPSRNLTVVVDPGNVIPEILEENNGAAVTK
ncbi:CARDB domain-containing protein [Candidatus Omnitrophota bacterium]